MNVEQRLFREPLGWEVVRPYLADSSTQADLVLAFGSRELIGRDETFSEIRAVYQSANILTCSTSGEILDQRVMDDTISVTAVAFNHTQLKVSQRTISDPSESEMAGEAIGTELAAKDLQHVFVVSDGQRVNGSELVLGLTKGLPAHVRVTGGLAGDAARFQKTLVGLNAPAEEGGIAAIGFYGDRLRIGYGSRGGWDSFGPDRIITKSKGNVLYELDGKCALDLYKTYLGDKAAELPGSALLFPLSVRFEGEEPVVRTILSIDDASASMTFAGDMPEGARARLMKANFDRLVDGASHAAETSLEPLGAAMPDLTILISCVGRKLVLDDRIEEEVESVRDVIGTPGAICGFYSYGEISPFTPNARCELHNQTMTITTFREV